MHVHAKKGLGQHFLKDENIAKKIVSALHVQDQDRVLEIGPGTGILTRFLLTMPIQLKVIEIDRESVHFLKENFPSLSENILEGDFLKMDIEEFVKPPVKIIGNFPYYISSQIFFKILDNKDIVDEAVCMIQKEVAHRIASPPGSKVYGILSVLLQAYYNIEYLFTVNEHVFIPPPKVKSAVLRLIRNNTPKLDCNESLFRRVVKATFNQRRKTIKNSLKSISINLNFEHKLLTYRPEQLSVDQFVELTQLIDNQEIN